jgi:ribosome-associated protein
VPSFLARDVAGGVVAACRAAQEKGGEEIVVLGVGPLLVIAEAFVLVTGRNDRHVRTLVEEVELAVKRVEGRNPAHVEGLNDAAWVLMDYGTFVVHVFGRDARDFYGLERLWADSERLDVPTAAVAAEV